MWCLARLTLERILSTVAVQTKGFGLMLVDSMCWLIAAIRSETLGNVPRRISLLDNLAKPALNHVQPRGRRGNKMENESCVCIKRWGCWFNRYKVNFEARLKNSVTQNAKVCCNKRIFLFNTLIRKNTVLEEASLWEKQS